MDGKRGVRMKEPEWKEFWLNRLAEVARSTRRTLTVRLGKGGKERVIMLPMSLENSLREYVKSYHPRTYLFEGSVPGKPLARRTFQNLFRNGLRRAGIQHTGGIHSLRHAFATHLLESGTDLKMIQALLGHANYKTTERYARMASHRLKLHSRPRKSGRPQNQLHPAGTLYAIRIGATCPSKLGQVFL
jgi:integrase/recombinase XerD